jgi:polyisoprenoid-binding protein YceI
MAKWTIDPAHAMASFSAKHMMITTVRGTFTKIEGTIDYDPAHPEQASVAVTIDVNSMTTTGVEQRDNHLKSPDFLDVAQYPTITFKSTKVEPYNGGQKAKITGDLTVRDVTKPVTLDTALVGEGKSPFGKTVAGFEATTKINREDWGLTWNMALETGGWLVGKEIKIELDVEAIKVEEPATTQV